ncbi:MAG: ATP-binding cassette domain-containing protein [Candidatus Eisenbacteria bacterium]|nr:ATP-binding cassette domain-containing protein [Candidatus Eisenbacteria bacterium]
MNQVDGASAEGAAIRLRSLTRRFGTFEAVRNVSLDVPRGQILGYLGPNGAGKTTTVKMATGMLRPSEGRAIIDGFDIVEDPIRAKERIGVVPETGALYDNLTPSEYLTLIGRLYHMDADEARGRAETFLRLFGIAGEADRLMTTFSRGMRQKVLISAALLHNPSVLFLDEPLSGLDANTALVLKELLKDLASHGKTVFYCSHVLEVVEKVCDRVVIIMQGEIIADGHVDELKEMTSRGSLEGVFSELTSTGDLSEIVRTFSESVTGGGGARE